jgi:hypothetical protein
MHVALQLEFPLVWARVQEEEERQEFELETQSKNPSEKLLLLTAGSTGHDATTSPDDDVADRSTAVPQAVSACLTIKPLPSKCTLKSSHPLNQCGFVPCGR